MHRAKEIWVRIEVYYGGKLYYPACDSAKAFTKLTKTKSLTPGALRTIEFLGWKVKAVEPVLDFTKPTKKERPE